MSTNIKLQNAVRLALGVSAGALAAAYAPGALAQDAGSDDVIEEIVTTGSRIRRADIDSASPVTVVNRQDILATGVTDVGNLLQRLPSMSGSPVGTTTNNGGDGSVQIDLRGLGTVRTLTLVNGKRTVDGGDYQTIPAVNVERVEILKDGASAVYGADAVAGVVNIITRKNFEGLEIEALASDWFDSKGSQYSLAFIAGKNFGDSNLTFGAEYIDQEAAFQSDAPWDFFQDSYYIYYDSDQGCETNPTTCTPFGSSRIPASRLGFMNQGTFLIDDAQAATTPYEVGMMIPHDGRSYNYAPVNYIQTPYERTNLFVQGNIPLSDTITLGGEIRGNVRKSQQQLAPMPYNSPTDPGYSGVFNGTAYNGISEDNYYLNRAVAAYNANPANAGNQLVAEPVVDARRRMIETTRGFNQDVTQIQANLELAGSFSEIDWDVYYNRGWRDETHNDTGQFFGVNLGQAMGPSMDADGDGQPECYTDLADPNTIIAGCVPFNFFGGGVVNADGTPALTTVTQDMIDWVSADLVDTYSYDLTQAGLNFTGAIWEMGGGEFGWAAGYEYRKEDFKFLPDSGKQKSAVTGNKTLGTEGLVEVDSFYAEVFLPIWDNGSQGFDLKGGVRNDSYNIFGSETTYQVGAELSVIESLKLRTTYGTNFRAPTVFEAFAGGFDSFPTYTDPCVPLGGATLPAGCAQVGIQLDTQVLARVGGNPDLIPEHGDTFTAGAVWTPQFGDSDLSVTVDYWQTELDDLISQLGVQFILDSCYLDGDQTACGLVERRADYSIARILDAPLNVASGKAEGVDTEIRWNFDTSFGEWETALLWAHMLKNERTAFEGDEPDDFTGRFVRGTGTFAEDKINYSVAWFKNDFSITYLGEYISALDADVSYNDYIQPVPSQLYHDLIVGYDLQSTGTRFSGGITNFTDEAPPYIDAGFNASTDTTTYRMFGIGYYLRISQSFQ